MPKRYIRMWHKDHNNEWCHSWDVEEAAFQLWKQGEKALPSSAVVLPQGKGHPAVRSRVTCGTCLSPALSPKLMKQELIVI